MRVYYRADRDGNYYSKNKGGKMVFVSDINKAHEFISGTRAYEAAGRKEGLTVISILKGADDKQ